MAFPATWQEIEIAKKITAAIAIGDIPQRASANKTPQTATSASSDRSPNWGGRSRRVVEPISDFKLQLYRIQTDRSASVHGGCILSLGPTGNQFIAWAGQEDCEVELSELG